MGMGSSEGYILPGEHGAVVQVDAYARPFRPNTPANAPKFHLRMRLCSVLSSGTRFLRCVCDTREVGVFATAFRPNFLTARFPTRDEAIWSAAQYWRCGDPTSGGVMRQIGLSSLGAAVMTVCCSVSPLAAQSTQKPPLHAKHWLAITGKPLAATAGALMFAKGGNAVDASCAMLAAVTTMWDVLSWGGETQALIYHPKLKKVIGINALGLAPSGATAEFYDSKGYRYPPEYGPLAAVTPGTPGGLMAMLAEYGTMSLDDVLAPAIQMADGYPIEAETANYIEAIKDSIKQWKYSTAVFLPHRGEKREAPAAGEIFVQKDLAGTLRKLVAAERDAKKAGKNRKQAIYAAFERFYRGDIARELVRGVQEEGGLITMGDLAKWKVRI